MKKLFALILAVVMIATMSVTAFAAEIGPGANASQGYTEISFNVDPTYTITIPATVELNKVEKEGVVTYENDYTVTAEAGVRLKFDEEIVVYIASDFTMETDEWAWLDYEIYDAAGDKVENNGAIAWFETDKNAQSTTIHIAANDPDYAGEYKDTVTFTVSYEDK